MTRRSIEPQSLKIRRPGFFWLVESVAFAAMMGRSEVSGVIQISYGSEGHTRLNTSASQAKPLPWAKGTNMSETYIKDISQSSQLSTPYNGLSRPSGSTRYSFGQTCASM